MSGVLINAIAALLGSFAGLLIGKRINESYCKVILSVLAGCTMIIGIVGVVESGGSANSLMMIISVSLGAAIGTLLDIDGWIGKLGDLCEKKFSRSGSGGSFSHGMVSAFLICCIGAMTVTGAFQAGLGDNSTLYTKSVLDFITTMMLASTLGVGVCFASIPLLIFEGAIALGAVALSGVLTAAAVASIECIGSVLLVLLGLSLLGAIKMKVANLLPAIALAPLVAYLLSLLPQF